jgi:hypothetical protein
MSDTGSNHSRVSSVLGDGALDVKDINLHSKAVTFDEASVALQGDPSLITKMRSITGKDKCAFTYCLPLHAMSILGTVDIRVVRLYCERTPSVDCRAMVRDITPL